MTTSETAELTDLAQRVREDPDLGPEEKAFSVELTKADGRAHVYTEIAGVMRRLLRHPEFDLESLRVTDDERFGARVDPSEYSDGAITGVEGTVPIGILKLQSRTRSGSGWATIVAKGDRSEGDQ